MQCHAYLQSLFTNVCYTLLYELIHVLEIKYFLKGDFLCWVEGTVNSECRKNNTLKVPPEKLQSLTTNACLTKVAVDNILKILLEKT